MERGVPVLQGRGLFRRQQRRRAREDRRVQLLQVSGRRRPDRTRVAVARQSAQRPARRLRRRQGIARAVHRAGGGGSGDGNGNRSSVTVPPSPNERGGRASTRRPTPRASIRPMRPWRGSASMRRPIGSGRRAMRAPASIAAGSRCPSRPRTAGSSATSAGRRRTRARP